MTFGNAKLGLSPYVILSTIQYVQLRIMPITRKVYSGTRGLLVGISIGPACITRMAIADIDSKKALW